MDKTEARTLGDALGMPDEKDKTFIRNLILEYEREHPGEILLYRNDGKKELEINGLWNGRGEFGVTGKQANMRMIFNLPPRLHGAIERYYPTMFREKRHFHWFVRNFKELMVPERY